MFIANFWLFVVVVLAVGALLGFAFFALRQRTSGRLEQLERELAAKTDELESYKSAVSEHFLTTAELVGTLTQSYKAVFDHLEGNAYHLVGEESFRKRLLERKGLNKGVAEAFRGHTALPELGTSSAPSRHPTVPSTALGHASQAAAIVIEEDIAEQDVNGQGSKEQEERRKERDNEEKGVKGQSTPKDPVENPVPSSAPAGTPRPSSPQGGNQEDLEQKSTEHVATTPPPIRVVRAEEGEGERPNRS